MTIKPWKTLESKYLIKDRWMTLRADRCETPAGVIVDPYYVQESLDWAHVVAFDEEQRILVTHQYRHGCAQVCTELPCGAIEAGEKPSVAMVRELREETGAEIESLEALPPYSPNPARYQNQVFPFIAQGTKIVGEQNLDATEEIEFEFMSIATVLELVDTGKFVQGIHISTLFLALKKVGIVSVRS